MNSIEQWIPQVPIQSDLFSIPLEIEQRSYAIINTQTISNNSTIAIRHVFPLHRAANPSLFDSSFLHAFKTPQSLPLVIRVAKEHRSETNRTNYIGFQYEGNKRIQTVHIQTVIQTFQVRFSFCRPQVFSFDNSCATKQCGPMP